MLNRPAQLKMKLSIILAWFQEQVHASAIQLNHSPKAGRVFKFREVILLIVQSMLPGWTLGPSNIRLQFNMDNRKIRLQS
jgi:hypothetical protein